MIIAVSLKRSRTSARGLERLCELNVIRQVRNVASDIILREAWARGQEVSVHGWVYSLANGLVKDLEVTMRSQQDLDR